MTGWRGPARALRPLAGAAALLTLLCVGSALLAPWVAPHNPFDSASINLTDDLALVGAGSQGQNLMVACLKIPGIRFKAVCDIWPYNRTYVERLLGKNISQIEALARERGYRFCYVATVNRVRGAASGFTLRPLALR